MKVGSLVKTRSFLSTGEIGKVLEVIDERPEPQYKVLLDSGVMYFYEHELVPITSPNQIKEEEEENARKENEGKKNQGKNQVSGQAVG